MRQEGAWAADAAPANAAAPPRTATRRLAVGDVSLRLLDCFDLRCDGCRLALPMSAQRLLVFLALRRHPVLRMHVAGVLWPESTEPHAFASLRSALWRVNQFGYELVDATSRRLWLDPAVSVDVHRGMNLAHTVLSAQPGVMQPVPDWALLTGDLLPDWTDEWILVEQERYRHLALESLEALAERLLGDHAYRRALEVALAVVAKEPLRESAHRVVMRIQLAQGNVSEALRQYRFYAELAQKHLGLRPSEQMTHLLGGLLAP